MNRYISVTALDLKFMMGLCNGEAPMIDDLDYLDYPTAGMDERRQFLDVG